MLKGRLPPFVVDILNGGGRGDLIQLAGGIGEDQRSHDTGLKSAAAAGSDPGPPHFFYGLASAIGSRSLEDNGGPGSPFQRACLSAEILA